MQMDKETVQKVTNLKRKLASDPSIAVYLTEDLLAFYADVKSSFFLAMNVSGMSTATMNEILDTVDDYVSNNYGE